MIPKLVCATKLGMTSAPCGKAWPCIDLIWPIATNICMMSTEIDHGIALAYELRCWTATDGEGNRRLAAYVGREAPALVRQHASRGWPRQLRSATSGGMASGRGGRGRTRP